MTGETSKIRLLAAVAAVAGFLALLLLLTALGSCRSSPAQGPVMARGTGSQLGTVSASATLTENRATGAITGDTKKYGFFDTMPEAVSRQLQDNRNTGAKKPKANAMSVAEKAYAVAVYDIIQQINAKGGDAVTNVLSQINRDYDMETRIETVTVSITASAIKTDKK